MLKAPPRVRARLGDTLEELTRDPYRNRPGCDCRKMAGQEGAWRVRVGAWRILYVVHDLVRVVQVTRVGIKPAVYQ